MSRNKAIILNRLVGLVHQGVISAQDVLRFEATGDLPLRIAKLANIPIPEEPYVPPLLVEYKDAEKYDVLKICRKVLAMEQSMCDDCRINYESALEAIEGLAELGNTDL